MVTQNTTQDTFNTPLNSNAVSPVTPTTQDKPTLVTPVNTKPAEQPAKQAPKNPAPVPDTLPVVELSREQRIMKELELRFLQIKELGDASFFSHEAICRKCGWHTMENSLEAATSLMSAHVVRHWKDVASQIK